MSAFKMRLRYVDADGAERTGLLRMLTRAASWLPAPAYDAVAWRLSERVMRAAKLRPRGTALPFASWGTNVRFAGRGKLELRGSFAIGNNTHFELFGPGSAILSDRVRLDVGVMIYSYAGVVRCGERVYLGPYTFVQSEGVVEIGDDTMIGPRVNIIGYSRATERAAATYFDQAVGSRGITIGKNVWIGAGATILDGVRIGDDAIIGAGSVVSRDVEAATVVAGVPARVLRRLDGAPGRNDERSTGRGATDGPRLLETQNGEFEGSRSDVPS